MLKDLDQSVNLLCDFYNLDLQLDEPIEAFLSGQLRSDLSPDPIFIGCPKISFGKTFVAAKIFASTTSLT